MAVKQKKRRWPDDEKRSICFQTTAAGVSVAQVARRYAMNANLIFKWLKDDRYAPAVDVVPEADGPVFLGAYILNLTGGNPALASVGTNVTQRPMTGKPLFGDRIAAKTGAAAAGEPARQAKYVSPYFCQSGLKRQPALIQP